MPRGPLRNMHTYTVASCHTNCLTNLYVFIYKFYISTFHGTVHIISYNFFVYNGKITEYFSIFSQCVIDAMHYTQEYLLYTKKMLYTN